MGLLFTLRLIGCSCAAAALIAGRGRATGRQQVPSPPPPPPYVSFSRGTRACGRWFSGVAAFSNRGSPLPPSAPAVCSNVPYLNPLCSLAMFSLGGKLFKQVDVNGDGSMEWEEFTGFCIETGLAVGGANSTLRVRSNVQRYTLHAALYLSNALPSVLCLLTSTC